ncbi:uncharacterized protein (DUF1778 family) [Roseiarcus fermentans]|uniref:Uncharacterized protein (DUF1778 family) n=1 Tax=Roseiarcus fermentans TaxID=1473586 RepID=A0A366FLG5_9HYPH|nr:DUF1778 domain-containing protein [Roseiarcus fermentans]RBP15502.1 uncharacterized protein (DUF1778 family) [Roseiarcus fermentans]
MVKARASASVLSVRVSSGERELLDAAAADSHTTISDFVRRAAIEAAEMEVLNRSTITIPAESWEAFEAWLNRPAEDVPGLVDLFQRKPTWER